MNIIKLLLISLFGFIGVVYIYSGKAGNNRLFLWCGIALALVPLILPGPLPVVAVGTLLAALPVLWPKLAGWFPRRKP